MKTKSFKFLADENISPRIIAYLRSMGMDVIDVKEMGWQGRSDRYLLERAYKEKRFVLTHDSDFGRLALHKKQKCFGIIFIRPGNLQPANVIQILDGLFQQPTILSRGPIFVLSEAGMRIRHLPTR